MVTCQYPCARSALENTVDDLNVCSVSSRIGSVKCSRRRALLSSRGSMHTRRSPDFFRVMTSWLTQGVGSSTCVIMPRDTSLSNSALSRGCTDRGMCRSGITTGCTVLSTLRVCCPGREPTELSKTSLCWSRSI